MDGIQAIYYIAIWSVLLILVGRLVLCFGYSTEHNDFYFVCGLRQATWLGCPSVSLSVKCGDKT